MAAPGRPRYAKNFDSHGRGPENWHFKIFFAAPASEAWGYWAALATGRPRHWRRDTPQCVWAGSVHSLTGQQDSMGRARYGAGLEL